jgi:diacylglycerol kinase (ATP)
MIPRDVSRTADPPRHAPKRDWIKNFLYATSGIAYAWRTERNFRLEVYISSLAIVLALLLGVNLVPVLICCSLVMSLELLNTALEAVVDLVSPTYHPLAKIAKDVAAGAVLLSACISLLIGLYLFIPVLISRVSSP